MDKNEYMKHWRQGMIDKGMCPGCGAAEATVGQQCKECSDKRKMKKQAKRMGHAAQGLCNECNEPRYKGVYCKAHYERNRHATVVRVAELKEQGICLRCRKTPATKTLCETCILKCQAHHLWNDRNRWTDLKALYDKQGGRCAYLHQPIAIGLDAAIDHRSPVSKGGTNDLSNLQWLHTNVNEMKWDLDEDLFLDMVRRIKDHQ